MKATVVGTVDDLFVAAGASVGTGAPLYDIRVETVPDPVAKTDAEGLMTTEQPQTVVTFVKVRAPAAGIVSALTVIHGQSVAIGEATGQIAPPPFTCPGLTISTPFAGATAGAPGDGAGTSTGGTTISCAVPADVTVFSGLAAEIAIAARVTSSTISCPAPRRRATASSRLTAANSVARECSLDSRRTRR